MAFIEPPLTGPTPSTSITHATILLKSAPGEVAPFARFGGPAAFTARLTSLGASVKTKLAGGAGLTHVIITEAFRVSANFVGTSIAAPFCVKAAGFGAAIVSEAGAAAWLGDA